MESNKSPTGPLTEELPSSVISAANKDIIESSKKESSTKTKVPYAKFTPEFKAKIAKYMTYRMGIVQLLENLVHL